MSSIDLAKFTPEYLAQVRAINPDLATEMENLVAEHRKLSNRAVGGMKVSEKGAISVYGLGRFPVTLYPEQWLSLFGMAEEIKAFIEKNKADPRVVAARLAHAKNKAEASKK